jgi:protein-S-isoprenylcysteine O-methyltransferase Ste14
MISRPPFAFRTERTVERRGLGPAGAGQELERSVTLKEDNQLIQSGPDRSVRHRINFGILVMAVGSGLLRGEAHGIVLFAFIGAVFGDKIDVGERLMSQQFPS